MTKTQQVTISLNERFSESLRLSTKRFSPRVALRAEIAMTKKKFWSSSFDIQDHFNL